MFLPFDYFSPATLKEALDILSEKENACPLAGGTDLIVNIRGGKIKPGCVVDLKKIAALKEIKKTEAGIEIGALVDMNDLAVSPLVKGPYSLLSYAASIMGCYEIRNRATVGGNVTNASPGAETMTPLTVLEAKIVIENKSGQRVVPISQFVLGVNKTDLKKGDIVTKIILPFYPEDTAGVYMRRQRVKGIDLASVNCSVLVINTKDVSKRTVRVAFGAVTPVPYRSKRAEELLKGKYINADLIKKASEIINSEINPRATSLRATPEYKRLMIEYFLTEGFKKIFGIESI